MGWMMKKIVVVAVAVIPMVVMLDSHFNIKLCKFDISVSI